MNVDQYNPKELDDCLSRALLARTTGRSIDSMLLNRLLFQLEQYVLFGRPADADKAKRTG